jgi:hypothetical protein
MNEHLYNLGKCTAREVNKKPRFTKEEKDKILGAVSAGALLRGPLEDYCSVIDFRTGYIDGIFERGSEINQDDRKKHSEILYSTTKALKTVLLTEKLKNQSFTQKTSSYLGPLGDNFD